MSLQTPTTYNPEAILLVLDGVLMDGFADEGITIEREARSEMTEGMDGGVTFEFNASRICKVTATFRAASNGVHRMQEIKDLVDADLRAGGAHPVVTGLAQDPISGSRVSTGHVFFLNQPHPDLASKSGTVQYEMIFANYDYEIATNVPA